MLSVAIGSKRNWFNNVMTNAVSNAFVDLATVLDAVADVKPLSVIS